MKIKKFKKQATKAFDTVRGTNLTQKEIRELKKILYDLERMIIVPASINLK